MFKKRLFAALTAAAMALGMLTGCGGTGNSGSAADGAPAGTLPRAATSAWA